MNSFQELILYTRKEGRKEDGGKQSGRKGEEGGNNFFLRYAITFANVNETKKNFQMN